MKDPMLNFQIFRDNQKFEAEFGGLVLMTGSYEVNQKVIAPYQLCEQGRVQIPEETDTEIVIFETEAMDEDDNIKEITKEMEFQVIQFINAQYINQ